MDDKNKHKNIEMMKTDSGLNLSAAVEPDFLIHCTSNWICTKPLTMLRAST